MRTTTRRSEAAARPCWKNSPLGKSTCHNRRFLHCHHVEHWSNGGETALDNLMLLCTRHHTLVHEGGFRVEKDYRDNWFFVRPDGIAVPECGYISRPEEIPPAGGLRAVAENRVSEPKAPLYLHYPPRGSGFQPRL